MNEKEVMALLEANRNEAGIARWDKLGRSRRGMKSFGIGLTQLRKLAKQVGRDHELAARLWKSRCYDAKIIGLLVDDPKRMTRDQLEVQVEQLQGGHLAHVFATCGAPLAKAPFVVELASEWMESSDDARQSSGYSLLYEISKGKRKSAPDDAYFLKWIRRIDKTYKSASQDVLSSMGGALMGMGKRSRTLNAAALKVAKKIGPIPFGGDDANCDPFDVVKHLTSDYLREKFAKN